MEPFLHRLKIQSVKAQLTALRLECASLAHKFEAGGLTDEHKAVMVRRWENALQESHALQTNLEQLIAAWRATKSDSTTDGSLLEA